LGNANLLEPNTIPISLTWRNFGFFEWLAFAARNIYLGHSHSPPLLQNCTSDRAGADFAARVIPRSIAPNLTVRDPKEFARE